MLKQAGLDPVETREHFAARRLQITAEADATSQALSDSQNALTEATVIKRDLDQQGAEVNGVVNLGWNSWFQADGLFVRA